MTKKNSKKEKTIVKRKTPEEIKEIVPTLDFKGSPSDVLRRSVDAWERYESGEYKDDPNAAMLAGQVMTIGNLDNQVLLHYTTKEEFLTFAIQFAKDLITEYDCKTPSEKALAQMASEAYGRMMQMSMKVKALTNRESVSDITCNYLNRVSKELDRAQRHFLTTIQTLKQLKAPPIQVHLRANTAFVAQNQQNIATDPKSNDPQ